MDIHASGRTDNSNHYSDDSRDHYSNFRNSAQRGRTRFSSGDDDHNYFRQREINDRTRDRELNYLNRESDNRADRNAGNLISDRNADQMRRNFSDLYRDNARRNLGGLREEDFNTPQPSNHNDRSRNHNDRSSNHNDRSRNHNDRSSNHNDRSRNHNDRSSNHNDRSRILSDINSNRNRRSRSNSSDTSCSTVSSENGVQRALEKMQKCMTPKPSLSKYRKAKEQDSRSKVLKARSLQQELSSETAKRVKKSMEHFMSTGPPMLNDNDDPQGFFKWQTKMKSFIERLPGYVDGMLIRRPDYNSMSSKEQGRLKDIYTNIHGWLTKAVSQNSRVSSKAKKIKSYPYPDIVKWWQTVHDMHSLSKSDLDRRTAKLHDHYQFDNEKCVTCFNRFELRTTELDEMGVPPDEYETGLIFYHGLLKENKRVVTPFMSQHDLDYTLSNMFEVSKWLDQLDEETNPNRRKDIHLSANLATEDAGAQNMHDTAARKRSRSQSVHNRESQDEPAYKKPNVYFNRENRSSGDSRFNHSNRSSRDRSRNRSYDSRGRSNDRYTNQHGSSQKSHDQTHYTPRSGGINTIVPLPQSTNPALTYEITPDGIMGWYWKGLQLKYTGSYEDVLDKCLGKTSNGNPSKNVFGDRRDDRRRRSNSIDARKIDERLSHAANLVYDSKDIITSFTYSMSLFEMTQTLTPLVQFLVFYIDNFAAITGYPEFIVAYFKLRDYNEMCGTSWNLVPMLVPSYSEIVATHAYSMIAAFPVTTTSTTATSTSSSSSSSISITGTGTTIAPTDPAASTINLNSTMDIQAVILQLQMLQSNPSLMNTMSNDVRQLVLSLGSSTPSTTPIISDCIPVPKPPEPTTERDFTNLTDAERIAYQQERTMKLKQSKTQSRVISNSKSTSKDNDTPLTTAPSVKSTEKKKTICLGLDLQRTLPIPGQKSTLPSKQRKISTSNDQPDLSRKPSDVRWETDMMRATSNEAVTLSPASVNSTPIVRQRGAGNLRKAPKRTDAYSPTTAAQKDQWDRKSAYVSPGYDRSQEKETYIVNAIDEKSHPFSHGEIEWIDDPISEDKIDTPTVHKVIDAHTDTDDVNVRAVSGETQHAAPSDECLTITREPISRRSSAMESLRSQEQGTASDRTSGATVKRQLSGSKTSEGIAAREPHVVRPEESVLPVLLDSSGTIQDSTTLTEEALQSILPMELTGHTPTEVGATEKLPPSPRESVVPGNVQGLERTPVGSVGVVRDVIPEDLLSTVSSSQSSATTHTNSLVETNDTTTSLTQAEVIIDSIPNTGQSTKTMNEEIQVNTSIIEEFSDVT